MAERQDKTNEDAEGSPLASAGGAEAAAKGQGTGSGKNLYAAEYLGSGTFHITKPKRKQVKRRQSQLKNPQRGARK